MAIPPQSHAFGSSLGGTQVAQQNIFNESKTRFRTITDWFSPITFAQKQRDVYRPEYSGSKEGFFESSEFKSWKRGDIQALWCCGIAGCGKTVLTSMIHEHLRSIQPPTARVGIACIYCDSHQQHIQTPENLLASLWSFFHLNDDGNLPAYISNVYRVHTLNSTRPDLDQIQFVIQSTIDNLEKAYILIDGLDEYPDTDQQETFMESIKGLIARSNISQAKVCVLITSRLEQRFLEGSCVQIQATEEEIRSMVRKRVMTPRSFRQSLRFKIAESPELQADIVDQIATRASGMFLIADLHIKSLASITNIRDLRERIKKLPEKLDQYYEAAWARIISQEQSLKEIAHNTISWVYSSRRQLKVDELRHALAVQPEDQDFCTERLVELVDILDCCAGLVVVERHSQVVRLMHTTTREFFRKQHERLFKEVSTYLARTCLTYLCLRIFDGETCKFDKLETVDIHAKPGQSIDSGRILSYRLLEYLFLDYAAENWGYHARGVPEESCLYRILQFLFTGHPLENAHIVHPQVFHLTNRRHTSNDFSDLFPVRVAITFGLERTACLLVKLLWTTLREEPRVQHHWLKALLEAIESGQLSVTEALLDAGVDPSPDSQLPPTVLDRTFLYIDQRPKTALDKSIIYGHHEIADLLVQRGCGRFITRKTVEYAVWTENTNILSLYLSATTDQKEQVQRANLMLCFATEQGRLNVVKFSMDHDAEIESEDNYYYCTALGLAVTLGKSHIVQYLLDAGAEMSAELMDLSSERESPYSLLQEAAASQKIFQNRLNLVVDGLKLQHSSIDTLDSAIEQFKKRCTARVDQEPEFLAAVREDSDHANIISMLLDHGADISVRGDDGESLLHLAVISKPRMKVLLEHIQHHPDVCLNVSTSDNHGRTPLHYAAAICNAEVMQLLIESGADASETDNVGAPTLYYAVRCLECANIAMTHGCRVDTAHAQLGTPLQFAKSLEDPNLEVVKAIEKSLQELRKLESLQPHQPHADQNLPNADSERFEDWMTSTKAAHEMLYIENIKEYLRNSNQNEYLEILAKRDAEAKKRPRTWNLVLQSTHPKQN